MPVLCTDTLMSTLADRERVAAAALELATTLSRSRAQSRA
jgi:hypothetical protein